VFKIIAVHIVALLTFWGMGFFFDLSNYILAIVPPALIFSIITTILVYHLTPIAKESEYLNTIKSQKEKISSLEKEKHRYYIESRESQELKQNVKRLTEERDNAKQIAEDNLQDMMNKATRRVEALDQERKILADELEGVEYTRKTLQAARRNAEKTRQDCINKAEKLRLKGRTLIKHAGRCAGNALAMINRLKKQHGMEVQDKPKSKQSLTEKMLAEFDEAFDSAIDEIKAA
jgi:vacuolar-type H+-ATPase subunit I/STV1|tara:strand:+ start:333 stop:1031 length:699 start_codon:yes stop_codon:yes gene_type:complete